MRNSAVTYLIDTCHEHSAKTAVVDEHGSYTFSRLLSNASDIAQAIINTGLRHQPIGIFLHKSKEMIAAFAGVNLAGCFYVPLDTEQPASRILNILTVLKTKAIVTDTKHAQKLPADWDGIVFLIDDIYADTDTYQRAAQLLEGSDVIDTDPIYSIFTSGSTGVPKGVVVSHRGVIDYIDWAVEIFRIDQTTVIGNQAPFHFDNSTLDIYLMYATGATLDIIPESNFAFPAKLIDYLNDNGITFVFWVPFVLVSVANFKILDKKLPVTLRDVFFAGEVMPNRQLNYWRRKLPQCRYVNLYGPTEITVDCTYYIVNRDFRDDEPLPIGKPCRNTDILILKDRQTLCQQGETGEICVRGSSLAHGYYNNLQKTTEAFIQNPLNNSYPELIYCTSDLGYFNEFGEVMFVGRADSQIKHKGYRIELGEIETAILGTNMVDNCCVVYDFANKKIVLFYQAAEDLNMAEFRKALATKIPRYMLPTEYHREEILRQNSSGKIDRAYYNKMLK